MGNNTQEAIFNLMQNIIDSLEELPSIIDTKNDKIAKPESDLLAAVPIQFNKLLIQQNNILKQIDDSKRELTNALKSNISTNETRNYEYRLAL